MSKHDHELQERKRLPEPMPEQKAAFLKKLCHPDPRVEEFVKRSLAERVVSPLPEPSPILWPSAEEIKKVVDLWHPGGHTPAPSIGWCSNCKADHWECNCDPCDFDSAEEYEDRFEE